MPPPSRSPRDYLCGEVLGLPPGETRPDHYSLLGLPFFEADRETIANAARERLRLLERFREEPRPGIQEALETLRAEVQQAERTLLDPGARKVYDAKLIGTNEPEAELPTGVLFAGRYRILRRVRAGGLGALYEALDPTRRANVFLSVLRPGLSTDPAVRPNLERAARAAASLDHPAIVRVDEVGDAEGLLYARTRAVQERDLVQVIEATPAMRLEEPRVRRIGARIARALAHAHAQGVPHGELRPRLVAVTERDQVRIADFAVGRAVADAAGRPPPRSRAPENEVSASADLFSLGCLLYQMLSGMPPFAARSSHFVPNPLPEDVSEDLEVLVMRLLARDPAQRPQSAAEVVQRLAGEPRHGRLTRRVVAVAGVALVALAAALLGGRLGEREDAGSSVAAEAWRLISEEDFDKARALLRPELVTDSHDEALRAAMAAATEGLASRAADPWSAQLLMAEAIGYEASEAREEVLADHERSSRERLGTVTVAVDAVTASPRVRVEAGRVPLDLVEIAGEAVESRDGAADRALELPEGEHEVPVRLVDRAGNERAEVLRLVVDRTPPRVELLAPAEGARLRDGAVEVRVRVTDANPAEDVRVRGRPVPVDEDGLAVSTFRLDDGEHVFDVVARDLAGLETRARRAVLIDSHAPVLTLADERVVTADGRVRIRGEVRPADATVLVDGRQVEVGADGSFSADVARSADGLVAIEATGPTGIRKRRSVRVDLDRDAPALSVRWKRRDPQGRILYGGAEMDAGVLELPLEIEDETGLRFEPADGEVLGGTWRLDPREGERTVRLTARDEAGNATELELVVSGHRARPHLEVRADLEEFTRADFATLEIEAVDRLLVQGREREPGRIRLPLAEGRVELLVQAIDAYGNETRWKQVIEVDRTPPRVRLLGPAERGVGSQELVFSADEELESITCFGRTVKVEGDTARIRAELWPGRKKVHVVARDLAGNVSKTDLPIRVVNRVLNLDGQGALRVALDEELSAFTVECWVRGPAPADRAVVVSNWSRGAGFALVWSSADISLPYGALEVAERGFVALPAKKAWHFEEWTHLALCYDGQRARYFVGGTLQHSQTLRQPHVHGGQTLMVGAELLRGRQPGARFRGAIDDVRVSRVCRYTRSFKPPRHHPQDEDTILMLRFDTEVEGRIADTSGRGRHAERVGTLALTIESR